MAIRVLLGVVSSDPLLRKGCAEFAAAFGFELVASLALNPWHADSVETGSVQCWLVDEAFYGEASHEAERFIEEVDKPVIYGLVNFSLEAEPRRREYNALFKKILREVEHEVGEETPPDIWVLGASLGGPEAIKSFLDVLPEDFPACFLYAQHLDEVGSKALGNVIGRDSKLQIASIDGVTRLEAGTVYKVPVETSIDFVDDVCFRTGLAWTGSYRPSIEELLKKVSHAFGKRAGVIFFSGMGEDGSLVAADMVRRGGTVWSQSAQSAVSSAMPESVIVQGICEYIASPNELALLLANRYKRPLAETANE